MKKYILVLMLIYCFQNRTFSQLSTVLPAKPIVTDTISVNYNSNLPNAKLKGKETIYIRVINYLQDGDVHKFNRRLVSNNGVMGVKLLLPKLTAFTKIEFYTLNKEDELANQNLIIYETIMSKRSQTAMNMVMIASSPLKNKLYTDENNKFKPVKGAYFDALFGSKPDSIFRLEIANHPTNYYAYAKYINVLAMVKSPAQGKIQIQSLLKTLNSISINDKVAKVDVGLMAAICVGNAKIGDLSTAKANLFNLFNTYPLTTETAFAFRVYNYEYYKLSNKQIEDDVRDKVKYIFINYPSAAINKNTNVFEDLKNSKDIPTLAFEKVLMPQYESGEITYYALGSLPELYIDRNEKLDVAKLLLKDAIKQFQTGSIQHQYRLNNRHYQMYAPSLMLNLAKVNVLEKENELAVLNTTAAIQILSGSNTEGNYLPLLLQIRSKAYTAMGNFNLAIADYEKLYLSGVSYALDSMQRLFPLSDFKHKSFNDYLVSIKPINNKENLNLNKLGNFSGTDLKGNQLSLSDLNGKIVVLNLWGIGCGPCIAEMPELNKLVKEYAAQPNVVFIAITGDDKESLVNFFKTRKFDYKVINNVKNSTAIFNTNALPVHMVIGKNGEIINRSIGAREDIKVFLKGVIEANL